MSQSRIVTVDGRRQRSERNKKAIIDAALALIESGVLMPTAQQVSDRAGVAMRTFFRHFHDMETLFAAIDDASREKLESFFRAQVPQGSLEERIEKVVSHRISAYEQIKTFAMSAQAQLWRSEYLRKRHAADQRRLRQDLDNRLPELSTLASQQREFADAMTSFDMWYRLRVHQGLSRKASIELVARSLKDLFR